MTGFHPDALSALVRRAARIRSVFLSVTIIRRRRTST